MMVYIHIPFCRSKCWYCSFNSSDRYNSLFDEYNCALSRQLLWIGGNYAIEGIDTIYIGGGTPSFFPIGLIEGFISELREASEIDAQSEFTIEANPIDITGDWLERTRRLGVNRISIGVQSFNAKALKFLGRVHDSSIAREAVLRAIDVFGPDSVSIDLIYGIPGQGMDDIKSDISNAVELGVGHISAYMFTLSEKGAEMGISVDDGFQAEAFLLVHNTMKDKGYAWYELSNFARDGLESRHNMGYWLGNEYIGIGSGAWSFSGGKRFSWSSDILEYIDGAAAGPVYSKYIEDIEKEIELLKLRTRFGSKYSIITGERNKEYMDFLIEAGFMVRDGDMCRLTINGLLFADEIAGRLL